MKFQIAIISIILVFVCCKKKENPVQPEEEAVKAPEQPKIYENYSALKVGNYWIYNIYTISAAGVETFERKDSVVIKKDTLIRGRAFYKFLTFQSNYNVPNYKPEYYADSLHYIISPDKIVFSSEDTTTLFQESYWFSPIAPGDTVLKTTQKMTQMNVMTTVPAGTFKTCASETRYFSWPNYISPGHQNPKFSNKRYAKGVGIVKELLEPWANYDWTQEKRLIRYKVD